MQLTLVRQDNLVQFPVPGELVLVRAIPFQALCEEHLLPFCGVVHIGYIRDGKRWPSIDFARAVEACSGGIQVQQKMTTRIGLWLDHQLTPPGLAVLAEAGYACTPIRDGARLSGPTTTLSFHGSLRQSAQEQREFIARTGQDLRKERDA